MTARQLAQTLNATGYEYYGDTAKGWDGNGVSRIYWGREYVTIESDGRVHGDKAGKTSAQTIGGSAVDAVKAAMR